MPRGLTFVLYFLSRSSQHIDGTVAQFDGTKGDLNWQLNCNNFTGNVLCQDSVEAGFA